MGIDPGRLSKWRSRYQKKDLRENAAGLSDEQKEIRLEHEILKKAVSIFSKNDGRYSDL